MLAASIVQIPQNFLKEKNIFFFSFVRQSSMNRMAIQALEKMETRKFKAKGKGLRESSCGASDSLSSSSTSDCAICLEKYIDGEVRKESILWML